MMIKSELVASVLLIVFLFEHEKALAYNVKCYICSTVRNETECRYPESYHMIPIECAQTALDKTRMLAKEIHEKYDRDFTVDLDAMTMKMDLNCLKVVTKVGQKVHILRGCQLAERNNADICHKIEKENDGHFLQFTHCSRCATDRCNFAPKMILNITLIVMIGSIQYFL